MHENDFIMTCSREIPSVDNIMNKIHLSTTIFNEFNSTYQDNKDDGFGLLFRHYTDNSVNVIYQLA